MMKRIGKKLLAVGLALSLVALSPVKEAEAAGHVEGCNWKFVVICMLDSNYNGFTHYYQTTVNGPQYCRVTQTYRNHSVYCQNIECAVQFWSDRVCSEDHKDCGAGIRSNLCQY